MKQFLQDFKKFLVKWNVVDIAIGFIFWAAFATVVKSFVNNIVMPPIWMILWKVDFKNLFIPLDGKEYESLKALEEAGAPAIKYWIFITDLITFIILGFILFVFIKIITNLQKKEEQQKPAPKPSEEVLLLREIRDLLAQQSKQS